MNELKEGQTTTRKAANQLRTYQCEEALNRVDDMIDALMKAHQRYFDALANDDELFGPAVQFALEERSAVMVELLAADQARQKIDW